MKNNYKMTMEMKRAIIFSTLDNFGKRGKFVVVCNLDKVSETLEKYHNQSTNIIDEEIVLLDAIID